MADGGDNGNEWTVRRLATHGTQVHTIVGAVFRGEPVAVTAGDDGAVRVWDAVSGALALEQYAQGPAQVAQTKDASPPPTPHALTVGGSGDQAALYSGWSDGRVLRLDLLTGVELGDPIEVDPARTHITAIEVFETPAGTVSMATLSDHGDIRLDLVQGDVIEVASGQQYISGGSEASALAVVEDADGGVQVCATAASEIKRSRVIGSYIEHMSELDIGWAPKSPQMQALPDGPLLAVTGLNQVTLFDLSADKIVARSVAPVGEISAITALNFEGRPVVAVGGSFDSVAIVDPFIDNPGIQPDGSVSIITPGPSALLAGPWKVGEAVTSLASAEVGGRDVLLVGGSKGGIHVVEPATAMADRVELQDDVPETEAGQDRLRRNPLAQALAIRLQRRNDEGREASFLVHLDGRWGSGKTTVLNFVAGELGDGWTVVRYSAWRQSRVGPPWWTLLTALRGEMMRRRSPFGRARLWFREMMEQRVLRASGLPATVLLVLIAAGVFLRFRPSGDVGETLTTVQGVAAALTALATLWAGAQFVARFFGWHSPRGAKAFQDLDTNPMDRVAGHFAWLVGQEKRPIAYFVDDIDRCPAEDVVELLENVQTLVRDAAEHAKAVLSPCFVVAGDGAWIRNAFEEHYADFTDEITEPGRPLGYLFLAKIFQLTLPIPRIGPERQAHFFRELLGLGEGPAAAPEVVAQAHQQVATAPNDDAQQEVLAQYPRAVREIVAPAAVRRQTEAAFTEATEHQLTRFAPLLPDNPRAVKRFLNAFAMTRSVRTVEHPDWMTADGADGPARPIPAAVQALLDLPEVQAVLFFADGGPLTPELVQACSGG